MIGAKHLRTALVIVISAGATPAGAQSPARPGAIELAVGPLWTRGAAAGRGEANETTGAGTPFPLFSASTRVAARTGVEGRLTIRIRGNVEAQGAVSYSRPELRIAATNDIENAAPVSATEQMQDLIVSGGALWYPPLWRARLHLAPFVSAEAGFVRAVHEARTLVETGALFQFGGGANVTVRTTTGRMKAVGLRIDARAVVPPRSVVFDTAHVTPAFGASMFVRF